MASLHERDGVGRSRQRAHHSIDAIAGIAEHPAHPPGSEPLYQEIGYGGRHDFQPVQTPYPNSMRTKRELSYAWALATLLSGLPSTLYALLAGGDPLEATRAAGAMVGRPDSIAAAALVHGAVSLLWAFVLWLVLPRRHTIVWALAAAMAIAVLDLRIIAPVFFPEVAALDFWPQFADHLMWGACVGAALGRRG